MYRLLITLFFLVFNAFAFAEESSSGSEEILQPSIEEVPVDYQAQFFRTLIVIIGILALIFVTIILLRRFSARRYTSTNRSHNIKIIEKRALSPQTMLYQVEIAGKQIFLAESKVQVECLSSFDLTLGGKE